MSERNTENAESARLTWLGGPLLLICTGSPGPTMAGISWMPWFHFPGARIAAVYHHSRLTWFRAALCSLSYSLLYTGPSLLYLFFACRCSTKTCNILKLSCGFKWFSLHFHPIYWQKTGPWKLLRGHCMKESRLCVLTILWRSSILRVLAILWMSPALRVLPSASKECPSSSNRTRKGNFLPWKSCNSSAFWKQMTKRCRHHEEDTKASLLNVCYGSIYTMSYFLVIGFYLLSLR